MITLKNVVLRRSAKVLLDKANVTINPGEKVGLVGRNGAGKSTLFGLLNKTLHEDGGDFFMPAAWRMAQVEQNMPETEDSATDYVVAGDTRLAALRAQLLIAEQSDDGMAIAHATNAAADDVVAAQNAVTDRRDTRHVLVLLGCEEEREYEGRERGEWRWWGERCRELARIP